jgi:hypothetical protein
MRRKMPLKKMDLAHWEEETKNMDKEEKMSKEKEKLHR